MNTNKEWEEEFDREFPLGYFDIDGNLAGKMSKEIKTFIQSRLDKKDKEKQEALDKQRERIVEEVGKNIMTPKSCREEYDSEDYYCDRCGLGYTDRCEYIGDDYYRNSIVDKIIKQIKDIV